MSGIDLSASPPSPDPAVRLRSELLSQKQRSGLSYARISALTHYSKSSWERWINGKQFPPRSAVESFARAARTDAGPLLELWDQAELIRAAGPEPAEPSVPASGRAPAASRNGGPVAGPAEEPAPAEAEAAVPEPAEADTAAVPDAPGPEADTTEADTTGPAAGPGIARRLGLRRPSYLVAAAAAVCAVVAASGFAIVHYSSDRSEGSTDDTGRQAGATPSAVHTAPVNCTQAGCTGKDPMTMGCSRDGQTLALTRNENMVIELRYSKACGASWGRITYAEPKAVVDVNNSIGATEATPVHWGNDVYSPMAELSGNQTAWACGTQPDGQSRTCTVHSPVPSAS
ncbi:MULTISPECIES: helix-turn-helix domain-containing protein [Streptomyces]|uniref:helix-turn-helix domain-containing protein n=1 Tax=Streptomyces TaxID=1883 RepID=UPI000A9FE3D8|nr:MULTISPECIES: XRE family transcriptional regulator [Streptomyces]